MAHVNDKQKIPDECQAATFHCIVGGLLLVAKEISLLELVALCSDPVKTDSPCAAGREQGA